MNPSGERGTSDIRGFVQQSRPQLAKLMTKYNVGCRDKDVLYIKQIDEGYFDETAG